MFTSKKAYGGYGVFDAEEKQVLVFSGKGAMAAAADAAEKINSGEAKVEDYLDAVEKEAIEQPPENEEEKTDEFFRGKVREGRGA